MSRRRPTWPELPEHVRVLIEDRLGASVVDWTSHDSGYSPGPALTLVTATDRVFVKAADVAAHPVAATFHRREAEVASLLPAGIPRSPGHPARTRLPARAGRGLPRLVASTTRGLIGSWAGPGTSRHLEGGRPRLTPPPNRLTAGVSLGRDGLDRRINDEFAPRQRRGEESVVPGERVEGALLDADAAVEAGAVVDGEGIEDLVRTQPRARWEVGHGLGMGGEVDAPGGTLDDADEAARTQRPIEGDGGVARGLGAGVSGGVCHRRRRPEADAISAGSGGPASAGRAPQRAGSGTPAGA